MVFLAVTGSVVRRGFSVHDVDMIKTGSYSIRCISFYGENSILGAAGGI